MWIYTKHGFIALCTDHDKKTGEKLSDLLVVRARSAKALGLVQQMAYTNAAVWYEIETTLAQDYEYRIKLPYLVFTAVMGDLISGVDYRKFKPSCVASGDRAYQDSLLPAWWALYDAYNPGIPYTEGKAQEQRRRGLNESTAIPIHIEVTYAKPRSKPKHSPKTRVHRRGRNPRGRAGRK
jgi:hypothetical protein